MNTIRNFFATSILWEYFHYIFVTWYLKVGNIDIISKKCGLIKPHSSERRGVARRSESESHEPPAEMLGLAVRMDVYLYPEFVSINPSINLSILYLKCAYLH